MAEEYPVLGEKSDEALLGLIQDGDKNAFAVLVKRYSDKTYRVVYRAVFNKNDAEDIVQEAFLKLWDKPHLWRREREVKFSTWFYRVVVNLSIDRNRKKKPLPLKEGAPIVDGSASVVDMLDEKERRQVIKEFLLELPEQQQVALNLCYYEGISNREAADIMGMGLKALESLLVRAKRGLRKRPGATCQEAGENETRRLYKVYRSLRRSCREVARRYERRRSCRLCRFGGVSGLDRRGEGL